MKNEMERINATLVLQQSEKKWMNTGQSHKIEYLELGFDKTECLRASHLQFYLNV